MDNNTMHATEIAKRETESTENGYNESAQSKDDGNVTRNFGIVDIWRIRRNAKSFRIHNRIPRL